jgi:hypothetical protein
VPDVTTRITSNVVVEQMRVAASRGIESFNRKSMTVVYRLKGTATNTRYKIVGVVYSVNVDDTGGTSVILDNIAVARCKVKVPKRNPITNTFKVWLIVEYLLESVFVVTF